MHCCFKSCILVHSFLSVLIFSLRTILIFLSIISVRCHKPLLSQARATMSIYRLVQKNYILKKINNGNFLQTPRYAVSLASDKLGRSTTQSPSNSFSILSQIPRTEQVNFVSKWQREGEHFVRWSTLEALNAQLSCIEEKTFRTNKEKKQLFTDLATVYFARFHNIIREEYQVICY